MIPLIKIVSVKTLPGQSVSGFRFLVRYSVNAGIKPQRRIVYIHLSEYKHYPPLKNPLSVLIYSSTVKLFSGKYQFSCCVNPTTSPMIIRAGDLMSDFSTSDFSFTSVVNKMRCFGVDPL